MLNIVHPIQVPNKIDSHPTNVAIHMVFVPAIYATALVLLGLLAPIPIASNVPVLHLSDLFAATYAIGYILLEPVAGTLILPFHIACAYYARYLPTQFPSDKIAIFAGILQVIAWVAQFLGHGLAEKRAPALLDNLFQALYLAPLFVWLEILFSFGYRPELKRNIEKEVEADKLARAAKAGKKKE